MKKITSFLTICLLIFGAITFQNCGPAEEPDVISGVQNEYMDADSRSLTHTYNVSPCPQEFESLSVSSFQKELLTPDSVVIISKHAAIDAVFESSVSRTLIVPEDNYLDDNILIWFTCAVDESFSTDITVKYYLKGEEIGSEILKLNVTVNK